MSVAREQRHTKKNPCPICGGSDGDRRGQGKRCHGFISDDGEYVHCSREELAGGIEQGNDRCFAHKMHGPCKCGQTHNADEARTDDDFEAVYDYRNELGTVVFQVVRKFGKRFIQRRPNGVGGWIYKLEGISRVLYKLPELLNDDSDRPVYIAEGEKDVDTLTRLGHTATCNPEGAGKWHYVAEQAREVLAGREVIIIADADKPGRKHAEDVRQSLEGVAASVRVVEAPALHKDVTELLESGGTLDQLTENISGETEPEIERAKAANDSSRPAHKRTNRSHRYEKKNNEIKLGADIHRVVDECSTVLLRCFELFVRSGELVRVVRDGAPPLGVRRPPGAPTIRPVAPATLLELLTRETTFVKFDKRESKWVPSTPNPATIAALAARCAWDGMRPLRGVLEAPALRPDGSIIQTRGYDPETGYLFEPSENFPIVPDRPSKADAIAARDELLDVVCDFPFATDAHRAAWLAFVLTLFARPAIDGCIPFIAVDATAPGTGKGRLVDVTCRIATGRDATKAPLPESDEEFRKRITALLLEGERLVVIDNVADTISMPSFDAVLTATSWRDRMLGKNASVALDNLTLWAATGNNLVIGGDLGRRTLHIRLESRVEDPEARTGWKHNPLLSWVSTERPRLVRAALTILRAHAVAGRPTEGVKPWGSFESWSAVVASAVAFVDMPNPQSTREGLSSSADTKKIAIRGLVDGWARLSSGTPKGITAKEVIERLYTPERLRGHADPDGFDDMREAIETLVPTKPGMPPNHGKLGAQLRSIRRQIIGGRLIDGAPDRNGVMRWSVRTAGDAGHAGDVPTPESRNGSDKFRYTEGNIPCNPGIPRTSEQGHAFC
ncbi:MAG: hypothetical protein FWD73_02340 [Polyangiaceae bacterium]|nr:hypothetical protein [Polyangiaceae bacterium]